MPRRLESLTLSDAKLMLAAGEAKAQALGLPYNIAIVDAGGSLIAFVRQDQALIGCIDLAISKATTARLFDKPTSLIGELAAPGHPLFGIGLSNGGKVVTFGGGLTVVSEGAVIGAVGASAGTVEEDVAVAQAAVEALSARSPG
ncbi:heme-binding protein [Caulobacter sp. 602-1]|uniref:GlcG/HbpS family heme-binding protein n=1 Tax=Caulobacter sp. 602-1 TaxID=2492472 RepID=UPI000F63EF63|nr:heme-binding protein [Caulobacter sp. 602-1]RRN63870.1 heme-binding protein [Caulobacter sp. 602-1]